MNEWSVQQQFTRYPIVLPILHKPKGPAPVKAKVGWTRDLSGGGARVELAERLRPQMPLRVSLRTDQGAIELDAQVVWAGDPPLEGGGVIHGIAFTEVNPDQLLALQDLLLSQGQGRQAGIRLRAELSVTCQRKGDAEPPFHGRTSNMSRGGLLVHLPQALPVGTALEVTLRAPSGSLTAEGEVVWVEPLRRKPPEEPISHGIRFTTLAWADCLALGSVLAEAA
jgi:hypothetical protein